MRPDSSDQTVPAPTAEAAAAPARPAIEFKGISHPSLRAVIHDASAEALHASILPLIVFMTHSVPLLLCYGKRLVARRLGIETIHERAPELTPTPFGLAEVERMARSLGPL